MFLPQAEPAYPEYEELYAKARIAGRFANPHRFGLFKEVAHRRGYDWCTAVVGRVYGGLATVTSEEAELLVIADQADINPPLPARIVKARAQRAEHQALLDKERAAQQARYEQAWKAAREKCAVPVQVRRNLTARPHGAGFAHHLGHVVPEVECRSGRSRRHLAGRALCESPGRARPLRLGGPDNGPATCSSCLKYTPLIRPARPATNEE
ncbi:hypothetical protein [Micromonospora haikouensis]|uniref:hypothetical protein n=1 Tax=Micromonospora haikouensis TaxID=686309 RepID=UPI003D732BE2